MPSVLKLTGIKTAYILKLVGCNCQNQRSEPNSKSNSQSNLHSEVRPRATHVWLSVRAGAGMIFSQGLMRMRSYEDIELAVRTMNWAHQGAGGQPPHPSLCCADACSTCSVKHGLAYHNSGGCSQPSVYLHALSFCPIRAGFHCYV